MIPRKLIGYGAGAACVSLFLLNDFLCTHLRLDSPPPGAQSCPSGIHIRKVGHSSHDPFGNIPIGSDSNGNYAWLNVADMEIVFGHQRAYARADFRGNGGHQESPAKLLNIGDTYTAPDIGAFTLEQVEPAGFVFGPATSRATFCFSPDPAFTVDPPILWRNKLIPDVEEPPHLWGGQDDTPPYYDAPDPSPGATTPQSDATPQSDTAPPSAPEQGAANTNPAADTDPPEPTGGEQIP